MYLPTKRHEEYIEYMKAICNRNCLTLVLKGSLAHGTAQVFSDIDLLLLGNLDAKLFDDIISGYDSIVMTNLTENPRGIYILNYKNGISVDLDIRESVINREIDNNIILYDFGFKIGGEVKRNSIINSYIPERPQWYKTIRLIHRCLLKYLCKKTEAAEKLADEVCHAVYILTDNIIPKNDNIKDRMYKALYYLNKNYNIDKNIIELLEELFQKMNYAV